MVAVYEIVRVSLISKFFHDWVDYTLWISGQRIYLGRSENCVGGFNLIVIRWRLLVLCTVRSDRNFWCSLFWTYYFADHSCPQQNRPREWSRKVSAAKCRRATCPHTWPDLTYFKQMRLELRIMDHMNPSLSCLSLPSPGNINTVNLFQKKYSSNYSYIRNIWTAFLNMRKYGVSHPTTNLFYVESKNYQQ